MSKAFKYFKELFYTVKQFVDYAIDKNLSRHAKSLTYSTMLALVPLLTVMFGIFAGSEWVDVALGKIQAFLIANFFPTQISKSIIDYLLIITAQAVNIKKIGYVFFLATILFLFVDMEQTFSCIDRQDIDKKWYQRLFSLFLLLLVPVSFFVLLGAFEWFLQSIPEIFTHLVAFVLHFTLISKTILFALVWGWFYFLYFFLPRRRISWRYLGPGSLLTATAFILMQQIFSLYLKLFPNYEIVYGAFSAIPVFLLWLYINWLITLYGFVITLFFENSKRSG